MTACRPQPGFFNPEIYSFFITSSTDWIDGNVFSNFNPNVFVDIQDTIDQKIKALSEYKTEIREYPHSRSIQSLKIFSQYWGNRMGKEYVEPFQLVRKIWT
jgi:LmbE family N-acetylglucosaminyl deacetylase